MPAINNRYNQRMSWLTSHPAGFAPTMSESQLLKTNQHEYHRDPMLTYTADLRVGLYHQTKPSSPDSIVTSCWPVLKARIYGTMTSISAVWSRSAHLYTPSSIFPPRKGEIDDDSVQSFQVMISTNFIASGCLTPKSRICDHRVVHSVSEYR